MFQFGTFQPHLILGITFNVWTCNCMPLRFHHPEWGAKLVKKNPNCRVNYSQTMRAMRVQWLDTIPPGNSAAEPHHSFNLRLHPLQEWSIQVCAREHDTDTQHPGLLPAFPSGFVIASDARSACIMSWDEVMSLSGFMFNHYLLGISVPDPSAFPAGGAQSREMAGPASTCCT